MEHDIIARQVMWNRLIAIVEEQAQTLQRTAFGTIVRESGDIAAGVFDVRGRMMAQAVTGTPGHINTMALAVGHVLAAYPAHTMKPGDVFIHNDPWMGTGHTNDISVTTPCFRDGEMIGLLACNSHVMDIGGDVVGSTDVFMEGLYLPIIKIIDASVVNEAVIEIIRACSRVPVETVGDVYSLIACNDVGCERLVAMTREFSCDSLEPLSDYIIDASRKAVLDEIRKLPRGTWRSSMTLDGAAHPITIEAALTVSDDGIHVDYTGSSQSGPWNINVPICYTLAYTSYAIGCVVAPNIPNNAGSLEPRTVSAPEGSIVNALKPAAVVQRHLVGLMLPDVVFGCLRQILPDRVPAESAGVNWILRAAGPRSSPARPGGDAFLVYIVTTGGTGAMRVRDGFSATGFPSGVRGGSVEIFESMSTLIIWRKELRADSGGAGRKRGGLGQHIEIENGIAEDFQFTSGFERVLNPARGMEGGAPGAAGSLTLHPSGTPLGGKGRFRIPAGERLVALSPGGGGVGDPRDRPRGEVQTDLAHGLISRAEARQAYGYDDSSIS